MRWTVQGADSATGRERSVTVEASTREEAEAQAAYNGLLVSGSSPAGSATPPASRSGAVATAERPAGRVNHTPPASAPAAAHAPDYADILKGAKALRGLATFANVLAVVFFILAAVLFIVPLAASKHGPPKPADFAAGLASALPAAGFGVAMLITSALLLMFASMGLALRDLTRNSFGK